MIDVRRATERGHAQHDWLESYHTFSFADYYDPGQMGFRALRVINEDIVQPGKGFGTHSHHDMEILTYALDGVLEHKDSVGNGSQIRRGDVQRMTAGTGITHSEFNHSAEKLVHFLQIWILPEREDLEPSYEQATASEAERRNRLRLIASRNGEGGAVVIHQDVSVYASLLEPGRGVSHRPGPERHVWVQMARGAATVLGAALEEGDGAAISGEGLVEIQARKPSEVLVFDLA